MTDEPERYEIVVSVGTDHHKFNRLIDWIDRSLENWVLGEPPRCLVQHGASREPRVADGVDRLPRDELLARYRAADVVVVQGGPGSILDAREVGRVPLVVARLPELKEVVDSHQVAFSDVMVRYGNAVVANRWEAFHSQIQDMAASPQQFTTVPRKANPELAAGQIAEQVEHVLTHPPERRARAVRRARQLLRRG